MATILLVDDERDMLRAVSYNLGKAGHAVLTADSVPNAMEQLRGAVPDLIVSDIMMPGESGLDLCRRVRADARTAEVPFIFLTAKGQTADKVTGLRTGADDYLTKPFEMDELVARVQAILRRAGWDTQLRLQLDQVYEQWRIAVELDEVRRLHDENLRLRDEMKRLNVAPAASPRRERVELLAKVRRWEAERPALVRLRRSKLGGGSEGALLLVEEALVRAAGEDPVLILGETGSGKTGVAEAIHALGSRSGRPMRTVNCAEFASADPALVMGKLFGYGRGHGIQGIDAKGQPGLLQEEDGGTIFFDELARLPVQAQALLLLPLEGRPFHPALGRGEPVTVNVRFIFATNADLLAEAEAGRFPRDLYQRIGTDPVRVPALRERPDDIPELARLFLEAAAGGEPLTFTPGALQTLAACRWPGNVRELEMAVRSAAARARFEGTPLLDVRHLPREVRGTADASAAIASTAAALGALPDAPAAPAPLAAPPAHAAAANGSAADFGPEEQRELGALRATRFQIGEAEDALGYSRKSRTLTHHLRGIAFKCLASSAFDLRSAAQKLAGGADAQLADIADARLQRYVRALREAIEDGAPDKLLVNLPQHYHRYVQEAVAAARAGRL